MDLLKAREKAKKQQVLPGNKKETKKEMLANIPLAAHDHPVKKDVAKIEKPELQETTPVTMPEPDKMIPPVAPSAPPAIRTEVKEILKTIFKDVTVDKKDSQVIESTAAPLEEFQVLIFRIGNELYGINLEIISEIIRYKKAAPIPNTPHYVHGLITLRGHMVPIINSHLRLNLLLPKASTQRRIIIVELNNEFMGLTVDEAFDVVNVNKNLVKAPPPTLTDIELELINGVYDYKEKLIILLNTDNFFKFL